MNGDLRFLMVSALVLTALLVAMAVMIWHRATRTPHFTQLDVERVNFVEYDGTPRLILYNSSHTPESSCAARSSRTRTAHREQAFCISTTKAPRTAARSLSINSIRTRSSRSAAD